MSGGAGMVAQVERWAPFRVQRISDDLPAPQYLTVLARHTHAVTTVSEDGRLVTILAAGRAAGPRALVVDRLDGLPDQVSVAAEGVADLVVTSETERFATRINPGWPLDRVQLQADLARLLRDAPEASLWATVLGGHRFGVRLAELWSWLSSGHGDPPRVAGFGNGLTPSSDDYLVGAHSVLTLTGSPLRAPMTRLLDQQRKDTTSVSAAMFDAAIAGRFPEAVLALYRTPGRASVDGLQKHGHTSGFDMAAGVLAALAVC